MSDSVVVNFNILRSHPTSLLGETENLIPELGLHFVGSHEIPVGIDFVERSFQVRLFGAYSVRIFNSLARWLDSPFSGDDNSFRSVPLWLTVVCRVCQSEANIVIDQELVPGYIEGHTTFVFCDSEGRALRRGFRRHYGLCDFYYQEEKTICQTCVINGCLRTRSWS
nr:MAG: putative movement protein P1 [Sobemovirus sp.]